MKRRLAISLIAILGATGMAPACASSADVNIGPRPQAVEDRYVYAPAGIRVTSWVENLKVPWSLVFLPDGDALVS